MTQLSADRHRSRGRLPLVLMLAGKVEGVAGCHSVKKGDQVTRQGRIVGVALDDADESGRVTLYAWMNAKDCNLLRVDAVELLLREIENEGNK